MHSDKQSPSPKYVPIATFTVLPGLHIEIQHIRNTFGDNAAGIPGCEPSAQSLNSNCPRSQSSLFDSLLSIQVQTFPDGRLYTHMTTGEMNTVSHLS